MKMISPLNLFSVPFEKKETMKNDNLMNIMNGRQKVSQGNGK